MNPLTPVGRANMVKQATDAISIIDDLDSLAEIEQAIAEQRAKITEAQA